MHIELKYFILIAALSLAACGTNKGNYAKIEAPSTLHGYWKSIASIIYWADGRITAQPDLKCTSEISKDKLISQCILPDGRKSRIVSNIIAPTSASYNLEITGNNLRPETIGSKIEVEYVILDGKLHTTVYPKENNSTPLRYQVHRVESVYIRE